MEGGSQPCGVRGPALIANRARTGILTDRRRPRERIKCQQANASNGELTVALALALGGHGDAWLTFARQQPFPSMRAEDLAAAARDYTSRWRY